jgi:PKD repeat protein
MDGSNSYDPDGAVVAWDWDFGDNSMGSGEVVSHTYSRADVYTVALTVTDDFGNTDTATTEITITEPAPLPPVADAGGPYDGTEGDTITLDGSGSSDPDGSIVRYDWSIGGDTLEDAGPNPTYTFTTAGVYNVTLTVTDDDGLTDSDTTTATISSVSTGDGDVYLTDMRVPSLMLLRVDRDTTRRITVFGDGDTEQDATVTLVASVSDPGLEIEIEPSSVTEGVEPDRRATRFSFEAEIECEAAGSYLVEWTAVIDADENADASNDSLTMSTEVECKGRTSRRGRDDDDDHDD